MDQLVELNSQGLVKGLFTTANTWEHLDFNIQPAQSIINTGAFAGWDLDGNGQGPFGDVRLRRAIAMCLDRYEMVDTLFYGLSQVPNTYLPPSHPSINTAAGYYHPNVLAASALLDQIGWLDADSNPSTPRIAKGVTGVPDGTPLVMNLETTTAVIRQQAFDILSKNLAGCGMQVNFQTYETLEYFKAAADGRVYGRLFDLAEFAWTTDSIPPCDLFLSSHIPDEGNNWSGQNNSGFNDPAYDDACNLQMQSLPGEDTYLQGVMEAQRIFVDQLPVIPLFLRVKTAAARPDMCGYSLDPGNTTDFWNIEAFDYGPDCK
jgi:peptide/nickel transport system substrate-binding protein